MIQTSGLFKIDWRDILKGLIIAALSGAAPVIGESISKMTFVFNLTDIWHAAAAGMWAYISVKFFTPAKTIIPAE